MRSGATGQLRRTDPDDSFATGQPGDQRGKHRAGRRRPRQCPDDRPARRGLPARHRRHRGYRCIRGPGPGADIHDHRLDKPRHARDLRPVGDLHGYRQRHRRRRPYRQRRVLRRVDQPRVWFLRRRQWRQRHLDVHHLDVTRRHTVDQCGLRGDGIVRCKYQRRCESDGLPGRADHHRRQHQQDLRADGHFQRHRVRDQRPGQRRRGRQRELLHRGRGGDRRRDRLALRHHSVQRRRLRSG